VIVTLERDNVLKSFEVQTDKRSAMISIPMKDEYLPNVYVTATLIKPHTETDLPLTVAHGFTSVSIYNRIDILIRKFWLLNLYAQIPIRSLR
jgi:uncharacterized protein YfaS (alpha-2-macroglobulin family)